MVRLKVFLGNSHHIVVCSHAVLCGILWAGAGGVIIVAECERGYKGVSSGEHAVHSSQH